MMVIGRSHHHIKPLNFSIDGQRFHLIIFGIDSFNRFVKMEIGPLLFSYLFHAQNQLVEATNRIMCA